MISDLCGNRESAVMGTQRGRKLIHSFFFYKNLFSREFFYIGLTSLFPKVLFFLVFNLYIWFASGINKVCMYACSG